MLTLSYHRLYWKEALYYYRWYQARRLGLGDEFLDEVGRALGEMEANPYRFALATAAIRLGQVGRFPFGVYYRINVDHIRILSLMHNSRGATGWKHRR